MAPPPYLPENPLDRFRDVYAALNAERGWFGDASSLRFAAISALTIPGGPTEVAAAIRDMAGRIKAESGWFGQLSTQLRFVVAAMLVVHGDDARGFLTEVKRIRELFREFDLRRGGIYETMAILVLRIQAERKPIARATIGRFKDLYEEMKRHHWWLTGPDDFPACAILTGQPESPSQIGWAIERIYQALRAERFSAGDALQTAANILFLSRLDPTLVARRYHGLAMGFRANNVRIWQSDYDELAILAFLNHPTQRVTERVLHYREIMADLRPRPDRSMTFNLAASIAFLDLVRLDENLKAITDAKAMMDMQAIINAQQAAAAAAASSACAASAAASS
ncbi:MAG: DUF4003 family protein [bacterium]|nr:DUF4003 family protein [bacterium]